MSRSEHSASCLSEQDWQVAAEKLFGPDYIIPLSNVLRVNRRTVERWRSGAVQIPTGLRQALVTLSARHRHVQPAVYGSVLKIVAAGHSIQSIRRAVEAIQDDQDDPGTVAFRAASDK